MDSRKILVFLLVTVFVAVLSGCDEDRAEVRISVITCGSTGTCPEFRISVFNGHYCEDLVLDGRDATAVILPTATSGTLRIGLTLYHEGEATGTSGAIELQMKKDWRYGVDLLVQEEDPIEVCFGCMGSESFDLDPVLGYTSEEHLFVVWGGNSISHPVVY